MYNYELNENKILVNSGEKQICLAEIKIEDDVAVLDKIALNKDEITSPITFLATLCSKTKSILKETGTNVEKVCCGELAEVAQYDQILSTLDPSTRQVDITKSPSMR